MARDVIYEGWLQKEGLGIGLIKVDLKDGWLKDNFIKNIYLIVK